MARFTTSCRRSHDLREVEQKAAEGNLDAQLAINVYA